MIERPLAGFGLRNAGGPSSRGSIKAMSCHHRRGQHRQSSSTSSLTRMMRASSWPGLLLLLAALLVLQPCGAPPINPGQSEELKLPVVHDTIKVGGWSACILIVDWSVIRSIGRLIGCLTRDGTGRSVRLVRALPRRGLTHASTSHRHHHTHTLIQKAHTHIYR